MPDTDMPDADGLGELAVQDLGFDDSIIFFNDPYVDDDEEFEDYAAAATVERPIIDPYSRKLTVAPYVSKPVTCGEKCVEQDKAAKLHCDAIRKRVTQWMKDSGCPSSLKGKKKKKRCK